MVESGISASPRLIRLPGERKGWRCCWKGCAANEKTIKMIKKNDVDEIENKVTQYKEYQDGLAKMNRLYKEIHKLLQEARDENLEEYP